MAVVVNNRFVPYYSEDFFLMKSGLAGFFLATGRSVLRGAVGAASGCAVSVSAVVVAASSTSDCAALSCDSASSAAGSVGAEGDAVPAGFSFFILKEGVLRGIDGVGDGVAVGWFVPFFSAFSRAMHERKV